MNDRYPRAKWTPAAPSNYGGDLDPSKVRLFVVHVAQGSNQSGIDAWFSDPAAKVSAHFSVSRFGQVHQHVSLRFMAWHCAAYNDVAVGIEHLGYSGQKLTRLQRSASLNLLSWLHAQFPQVPLRVTGLATGHGVTAHGWLGELGGDHPSCPGSPIIDQFEAAYRRR